MTNKEFERLIEESKEWVRLSKSRGYDFDSILAGLYNDPSHFIYEILQNAEDENAKKVEFKLFGNRLDIYHDGNLFNFDDIKGVTGIGIPTKKGDPHAIGKFGIGFKSVFAVTDTPYIFSGEYKIKIEDFVIPSVVDDECQISGTLIRLPFNHIKRTKEKVFRLVSEKLKNLGLKTLLFLKNIEEIRWETPSSSGHYLKSSDSLEKIPITKKVTIISSSITEEYIVIGKPIRIEGIELRVEVAYKLGKDKNGKEIIIQEPDSKLVVFFPTEKVTFLNFVIQGHYKTTPNRENIPLDDEQNKAIIEETGSLIAESLSVIKDMGYFDANFLSLLPIISEHKENEQIYSVIYKKVKENLLSEELLPTSDGKYTKASEALLADGKELTGFLTCNDIQYLFSKNSWLDTNITDAKTRELRNYLKSELGILEVDFESFARKISVEFLQTKSDEWMIDFYSWLINRERGYSKDILRTKPIIRLETNEHIAPFDAKGGIQVYLPTETKSKYKTVKRILTENENSLKFLKDLGLTKPNLFAEIREFILPKYQTDNPSKDEGYFEDFEKLLTAYETIASNKKKEFTEELSKASFIDSVKNDTGESHLWKSSETYFNDRDLKDYFDGYHSVYFISDELNKKFGEERLRSFFIDLGVEDKPRRIEIEKVADLSWEERVKFVGYTGREVYLKDYEYEGLDNFINNMTISKSFLLWKLLLKNIETLSSWAAQNFFEGKRRWFYQSEHYESFYANFITMLRQQAWLVDKNNYYRKPSDIAFSELSDNYIKESPNIDTLLKALGFRSEIIDQLPEEDRKKYQLVKGYSAEELEKIISAHEKKTKEVATNHVEESDKWTPECSPKEAKINIKEYESEKLPPSQPAGEKTGIESISEDVTPPALLPSEPEKSDTLSGDDRAEIGRWGEEYVLQCLKDEKDNGYKADRVIDRDDGFVIEKDGKTLVEVIWLNKHKDKRIEYDIKLVENGITYFIEVKTTKTKEKDWFDITQPQWKLMQKEGDKFWFYRVYNAGSKEPEPYVKKLQNPAKLWQEGSIVAYPVRIQI